MELVVASAATTAVVVVRCEMYTIWNDILCILNMLATNSELLFDTMVYFIRACNAKYAILYKKRPLDRPNISED